MKTDSEKPVDKRSAVSLREVNKDNFWDVIDLSVSEEQKRFVATNSVSIAEAHFWTYAWFRAIYADETVVGFLMLADSPEIPEYYLWRFMIDSRYQKQSFGQKAIQRLVEHVKTRPKATELSTSVVQAEGGPQKFYEKLGFRLTGDYEDGEAVMKLIL